ncbi:MAG: MFS transporter [Pacificimonas sp.]
MIGKSVSNSAPASEVNEEARLPFGRLCLFALPALPAAALSFPIGAYLPPFYAERLGIDLALVGLIFMAARLWDIITDPLMGYLSDHTSSRWGRRKPWLVAAMPVLLVGGWLLFFPEPDAGPVALVFALFVSFLGFTMLTITHLAWAADLGPTYDERSRLQGAVLLASIAGLLSAMVLPAIAEQGAVDAATARVEALGIYALVLLVPTVLIAIWSTPSGATRSDEESAFRDALRRLLKRPEFRRLLAADFVQGIAGGMLLSGFIFTMETYLGVGDRAGLLLLLFMASGMIFVPIWALVAKRLGKHRTVSWSSLFTIPFIAALFMVPYDSLQYAALAIIGFGSTMGVWIFLTRAIVADLDELERLQTGRRQTASAFALVTLSTKLGQAAAVGIGVSISSVIGFVPGADIQNDGVPLALALLTFLPPIVGHLIIAAIMFAHPDDRGRLQRAIEST